MVKYGLASAAGCGGKRDLAALLANFPSPLITWSRRVIQELTAGALGDDGDPLETELLQMGSGGGRCVRLLAPAGNGFFSMCDAAPAGAVPGAAPARFVFHPRGRVQPFHAYFIPIDPCAARLRPSLPPTRCSGVPYLFIFGSSGVK